MEIMNFNEFFIKLLPISGFVAIVLTGIILIIRNIINDKSKITFSIIIRTYIFSLIIFIIFMIIAFFFVLVYAENICIGDQTCLYVAKNSFIFFIALSS